MSCIVVRRKSAWADKLRKYRIVVDGAVCGTVTDGAVARVAVHPGRHVVRLKIAWCWSAPVEVDVARGAERVLECAPATSSFLWLLYATFWRNRYISLRDAGEAVRSGTA